MSEERIVIVGASLAGARAAEGARDAGFEGEILLIGEEPDDPYERPPLSKDYLRGEKDQLTWVHDAGYYGERGIDLRLSTFVSGIDPSSRTVQLDGANPEPYDRLLLATGYNRLFAAHIGQADEGCDFDVLQGRGGVPEPEIH